MNPPPYPALDQAREQLREAEAERRNPRGRGLYWQANDWEKIFEKIIELEDSRDKQRQELIEQARKARQIENIQRLTRPYDSWVSADVAWYKARENELRLLRERWDTDHAVEPLEIEQLTGHYAKIAYRLRERRVVLGKIAIEVLEDRRQQSGEPIAQWPTYWNRLVMEFRAQDSAYPQAHAKPALLPFNKERLRWCTEIRRRQLATKASKLGRSRNFDHAGLDSAIALVDKQITYLLPPPTRKLDIRSISIIVAIVLFVVFAFSALSRIRSQPTDAARPTAGATESTAVQHPVVALAAAPSDANTLNQQGIEMMRQARYEEARELFQQAAAANASWHEPPNNLAFCLYELGQPEQAITQWRLALELSQQNSPDANAGLGMALYYVASRTDEGLRYYQRAIALNADYRDENTLRSKYLWGDKAIADSRPLREQLGR